MWRNARGAISAILAAFLVSACTSTGVEVTDGEPIGPDGITTGSIHFAAPESWLTYTAESFTQGAASGDPLVEELAEISEVESQELLSALEDAAFYAVSPSPPGDDPVGDMNLVEIRSDLPSSDSITAQLEGKVDDLSEATPFFTDDGP